MTLLSCRCLTPRQIFFIRILASASGYLGRTVVVSDRLLAWALKQRATHFCLLMMRSKRSAPSRSSRTICTSVSVSYTCHRANTYAALRAARGPRSKRTQHKTERCTRGSTAWSWTQLGSVIRSMTPISLSVTAIPLAFLSMSLMAYSYRRKDGELRPSGAGGGARAPCRRRPSSGHDAQQHTAPGRSRQ